MNENKRIPVVMSIDNAYIFPTCVTVLSALKNKESDTAYLFVFLADSRLSGNSREILKKLKRQIEEFEYRISYVNEELFTDAPLITGHLSKAAYYRLATAGMVDDIDKCIYLDGDTLVNGDLTELYETELGDSYIAGVKNWGFQTFAGEMEIHRKQGGLPSMDQYINSGVLLMNLKQIRRDKLEDRFLRNMPLGYLSEDQDILNICCYGKIYFLPLKYNIYNRYLGKAKHLNGNIFTEREREDADKQPVVVHFASGITKPWNNVRCIWNDIWWKYAEELRMFPCNKLWEKACGISSNRDYETFLLECEKEKGIIIFGYTQQGIELGKRLEKAENRPKIYFCDNDSRKQGYREGGHKVYSAEAVFCTVINPLAINMANKARYQVRDQILSLGTPHDRIINYFDLLGEKTAVYYTALKKEYYDLELWQIYLIEEGKSQGYEFETYRKKLMKAMEKDCRIRKSYCLDYWLTDSAEVV